MNLDDRDRRILDALADNAWLTYVELGALANLSASATQRRVERLIEAGAIEGAAARIAPAAMGRALRIYVLIELKHESNATLAALARRFATHADVVEAHYLAGAFDVIVTLQVASMEAYAAFAAKHLNDNPSVRRYKTLTSLRKF